MMISNRDDLLKKIRALRARAEDEASSEAEVEAAAKRAAKLILQIDATEEELRERGTSGVIEGDHNAKRRTRHPALDAAVSSIALVTQCLPLTSKYYKGAITWIGQPEDVEFAIYLSELVQAASERAYRGQSKTFTKRPSRHWRNSFLVGFGHGVSNRLITIEKERQAKETASKTTGTELSVVKAQIISGYLCEAHPELEKEQRKKGKAPNLQAATKGMHAANSLKISTPITEATPSDPTLSRTPESSRP